MIKFFHAAILLALALPTLATTGPDQGEVSSLEGLRRVWSSVQSVVLKSDISGATLEDLKDQDRDMLKDMLNRIWLEHLQPGLRGAGLQVEAGPVMVEDALKILHQMQDEDPDSRVTRENVTNRARRSNRAAPRDRDVHLRLFIEIQQDGLKHVARLELALIEKVSLDRRPTVQFHTVTWLKSEEAVDLGVNIDERVLRDTAMGLVDAFTADLAKAGQ